MEGRSKRKRWYTSSSVSPASKSTLPCGMRYGSSSSGRLLALLMAPLFLALHRLAYLRAPSVRFFRQTA